MNVLHIPSISFGLTPEKSTGRASKQLDPPG